MNILQLITASLVGILAGGFLFGIIGIFAIIAVCLVLTGSSIGFTDILMAVAGATVMGIVCEKISAIRGCEKGWYKWGFCFGILGILITFLFGKKVTDAPRRVITIKSLISYALHAILVAFMFVIFYPFLVGFFSSFKEQREILISPKLLPEKWMWDNYVTAWTEANFARYTLNSAWYTAATIVVTVLTSTVNGYAFARGEFRGKSLIFALFSSLMFITLGSSSLYPTMQLMNMFGLTKLGLLGLVIKGFFAIHITDMYLVRGFINQLPKELDEAATIDGCGFIGIFFRIILPLLKPMVATLAILTFSNAWNNYLWPMIVTMGNEAAQPLSVGLRALQSSGEGAASWHIIMAGSMISAIPMMLVYLIFNKYFVKGLSAGAVKG